jgi:hypothetical protein
MAPVFPKQGSIMKRFLATVILVDLDWKQNILIDRDMASSADRCILRLFINSRIRSEPRNCYEAARG